jgi:hypothetical protein
MTKEMEVNQPVLLNIKMHQAGVDLCLTALRKLPHEQVDPLIQDLYTQGRAEVERVNAENAPDDLTTMGAGGTD